MRKYTAEFIGTFWLVLGGCGSAVLAAAFPEVGIGLLGVSLTFGLTVMTMAFSIGHISGCHLNPAVSIGLWAGGRFQAKELTPYIIAQVLGGIAGAALFQGGLAMQQLWLFWIAPIIGAIIGAAAYRFIGSEEKPTRA
jgi:aquaporin Z